MTFQRFLMLLSGTSVGLIAINLALQRTFISFQTHSGIAWWSLILFVVISGFMYGVGKIAAASPNRYLFNNIVIGFVILKMTFSIVMLMVYKKNYHPEGKMFLVPFFMAYLVFTIFETYFMMQLTQSKKSA